MVLEGLQKEGTASGGEQYVLDLWQRQIAQEQSVLMDAVREYDEESAKSKARRVFADLGPSQRVQLQWYEPLVAAIEAEQKAVRNAPPYNRLRARPATQGLFITLDPHWILLQLVLACAYNPNRAAEVIASLLNALLGIVLSLFVNSQGF